MRKFYSLIAMFALAIVANAQVLINYEHAAAPADGITLGGTTVMKSVKIHANADAVDCIQLANSYVSSGELTGNDIKLSVEGGLKAGDVITFAGFINNKDEAKYASTVIYVKDDTEAGYSKLWESEQFINAYFSADEPNEQSYTLEADYDAVYFGRNGNTGADFYTIKVTRPESAPAAVITYENNEYSIVATQSITVDAYAATAYQGATASFADQLPALLAAVGLESVTTAQFIQFDVQGNGYEFNTNDGWHSADGLVEGKTWGSEEKLVCIKPWSDAGEIDGTISYIGCIDELWAVGDTHTMKYAVINNGKAAVLEITLNFVEAPEPEPLPEIAEPAALYSELEFVKEYTVTIDYREGKQYEGQTTTIDVADIYEVLGVSAESLEPNIENVLLARRMDTDEAGSVSFGDSLLVSRFGTDGWFGRYTSFDESTGEETAIVQNGVKTYGGGCTFYLQSFKLEEGVLSFTNGQYPGTMKPGDEDWAEVYIVNGNKAVKVIVKANILPMEVVDFADMTKVGEQTISGSLEVANGYTSVTVNFDAADILAKLGCEADDVQHWNLASATEIVDPTTNDYWQDEEGHSLAWSQSPCCQVTLSLSKGEATLLQMAGKYMEITEAQTFPMYYILSNGANYYMLNFNFTLKPVKQVEGETTCVSTEAISKQIIPANSYDVEGLYSIDLDYVESLIGTRDFALYGEQWNEEEQKYLWTKSYTCYDTANKGFGFWYGTTTHADADGNMVIDNEGWNCASTNAFGFQIFTNGNIMFFQYPNARQVGDGVYAANIYLVNEETGAYIHYIMNVRYVDEIAPDAEVAGTANILADASTSYNASEGLYAIDLDVDAICEALGIDAEELEAVTLLAPKSATMWEAIDLNEDALFNANGYVTPNEAAVVSQAHVTVEDGKATVFVDAMDIDLDAEEATSVVVRFAMEYNGKRYVCDITLANPAYIATGINAVNTLASAQTIYTVNGVKVAALQRGLNIVKLANGSVKKVLVK